MFKSLWVFSISLESSASFIFFDKTMELDQIWDFEDWYKNNIEDFFKKEFNINGVGTS